MGRHKKDHIPADIHAEPKKEFVLKALARVEDVIGGLSKGGSVDVERMQDLLLVIEAASATMRDKGRWY